MNDIPRLMPWIGGAASAAGGAAFSPLVSPIDETVASHMIESDAAIVDTAVVHAHKAYLANLDATTGKRVEVLLVVPRIEIVLCLGRDVHRIEKQRPSSLRHHRVTGRDLRALEPQQPFAHRGHAL